MVKRYIKRSGKTYGPYHYKSKRVGKKVKSIYVGKEHKGKIVTKKKKAVKDKHVHDFKIILRRANIDLENNKIAEAMDGYNQLTELFNKIKNEEDKKELFDKAKEIYDKLSKVL
jgi:hypothetical protein